MPDDDWAYTEEPARGSNQVRRPQEFSTAPLGVLTYVGRLEVEVERLRDVLAALGSGWKDFYDRNVGAWEAEHDEPLTLANYVCDALAFRENQREIDGPQDAERAALIDKVLKVVEALRPNEAITLPGEAIVARSASGTLRFANGWFQPTWRREPGVDGLQMAREHVEMLLTGNPFYVSSAMRELSIPSTLQAGRCENVGRRNFHFVRDGA